MVLLLVVLSYALAIPLCRQASSWDAAQLAKYWDGPNTQVYIYGGRYPVSFTYYSGIPAPDLNTREKIDQQKPDGISWNAKNMMPLPPSKTCRRPATFWWWWKKATKKTSSKPCPEIGKNWANAASGPCGQENKDGKKALQKG